MRGLLLGSDEEVARWAFTAYRRRPSKFDAAVGIVDDGQLVGAAIFQAFNGVNIELSYYGNHTLTPGIARSLARVAIGKFDPSRVTVVTARTNRRLIRALQNLGFVIEGAQRRYYGDQDCRRNTGVRLVMFKERVAQVAGFRTRNVS